MMTVSAKDAFPGWIFKLLEPGGVSGLRDPGVGCPTGLTAKPGANAIQLDRDANWQSRIRGDCI